MAKTDFKTIDEYLDTLPEAARKILGQVRTAIKDAVPNAEETISYQIPAIKYHGWIFYFSAYQKHYSLAFPPPSGIFEVFKEELARYKQTKSTIQFPLDEPVPVKLIDKMARFKAKENLDSSKAKTKK